MAETFSSGQGFAQPIYCAITMNCGIAAAACQPQDRSRKVFSYEPFVLILLLSAQAGYGDKWPS
jgi:hypothetical protein